MIYPLANLFGVDNWIIILIVGLLLFGRRLPEVGRSLGMGIVEFKKGLQGIEEDIDDAGKAKPRTSEPKLPGAASQNAGYKFDPYTGKPLQADPVPSQQMRFDPYTGKPLTGETTGVSNG
jgi:sec-independent protein translocase protein TatA